MTQSSAPAAPPRDELARRSAAGTLSLYYIGPDRDLPMIQGLDIRRTDIADAEVALCIGLVDDMNETVADYAGILQEMKARGLLCSAPIPIWWYIAGPGCSIAPVRWPRPMRQLGGEVIYYGKPHLPVYKAALAAAAARGQGAEQARNFRKSRWRWGTGW